jgi:hypothetical protein
MVKGLDLFSKCAIAESGIGEDAEADVVLEPPVAKGMAEGWLDEADRPDAPPAERTELVDFDELASAPDVLEERVDAPAKPDRPDRCAPDIPLVEETASVFTEVVALLADDLPEVEVELGLAPFCEEEFCR